MRHLGVPQADARLLRVTAHTPHGAVLPTWFPAPLDGILASVQRRRTVGPNSGDHHVVDIPLVRVDRPNGTWGKQWVWAATCAQWDEDCDRDLRYVHQRFDVAEGENVIDRLPAATDVGRYKPWRIPVVAVVAPTLTWWAVGDPARVKDLLDWRVGVGARRGSGEGVVTDWTVTDEGAPDLDRILWHQGRPARPLPSRAATQLGLDAPDVVPHQIRPPYWRAAQTSTTEGTGFGRAAREVIAPWTQRTSTAA